MTKRHENLWLQGKELDERVLKYWADPPEPFQENLAIHLQSNEVTSSGVASRFFCHLSDGVDSGKMRTG